MPDMHAEGDVFTIAIAIKGQAAVRIDKGSWGNWIKEGWPLEQVTVSARDREILRSLAHRYRALCDRPGEAEKIRLWTDHNDLRPTRPVVLVDMENGWNETVRFDRDIECEGYMAQDLEMWFRKEFVWTERIKDDKPFTPVFCIPHRAVNTDWGIGANRIGAEDKNKAYHWKPILGGMGDEFADVDVDAVVEDPYVEVDWPASNAALELVRDLFGGILEVRFRTSWFWSSHIALAYSNYRGLDGMMTDFYDYPDAVHRFMDKFTAGYIRKLRFLEENRLLHNNVGNCFVGSGGLGWTERLHPDPDAVRLDQMWGLQEAQEITGISPEMYAEFIFPYHARTAELFGLNCYACCEAADPYWESVKKLRALRRVSVSQWADLEKMAANLGREYILSYKACSSDVALPNMNESLIRSSIGRALDVTVDNNVEIVLKDLHTVSGKPEQVYRWVEIVREEIGGRRPA